MNSLYKFPKRYLWPEKPTFLGFLIMVSIYNFLKGSVLGAKGRFRVKVRPEP